MSDTVERFESHKIPVEHLVPGYLVNLYGDKYADPTRDIGKGYAYELTTVCDVPVFETDECVVVGFEHDGVVGFPPGHLLSVEGMDHSYDEESER